ncbi:MAG: toxin glutamine deamidase domain-containing protein [Acidimicrobiales bacterium]
MTGEVGVRADPAVLASLAAAGSALAEDVGRSARSVAALQSEVRAGCGGRAVWGDGIESLDHVVADIGQLAAGVAATRGDLLAADMPLAVVSPTSGHSLGPLIWPGPVVTSGGRSPWIDPESDSLVVALFHAGVTGSPSATFLDRLQADGPGVLSELTDTEMGSANQVRLLLSDRDRFVDNWLRAGAGAVQGVASVGTTVGGIVVAVTPGMDDTVDAVFGRRPGEQLQLGVANALRSAVFDPDSLAEGALGWEQYRDDPYRWLGATVPEIGLEVVTAALPVTAARRTLTIADLTPDGRGAVALRSGRLQPDALIAGPFPNLAEFRRAEADWAPADPITSHRAEPFETPEAWVADINGAGPTAVGRRSNCIDCARAVEANWRGDDAVAAPLADPTVFGSPSARLEDWTGGSLRPAAIDEVGERLTELGPGSSALVTSAWHSGGAHAYNAVNDAGTIRWVDGQVGETSLWPPPYAEHVEDSIVIFIDPDGNPESLTDWLAEEGFSR